MQLTRWRISLWRLKKLISKRVFIEGKILPANYPKRITVFTMNFWKLIAICDSRWLNSRPSHQAVPHDLSLKMEIEKKCLEKIKCDNVIFTKDIYQILPRYLPKKLQRGWMKHFNLIMVEFRGFRILAGGQMGIETLFGGGCTPSASHGYEHEWSLFPSEFSDNNVKR